MQHWQAGFLQNWVVSLSPIPKQKEAKHIHAKHDTKERNNMHSILSAAILIDVKPFVYG